MTADNRTTPPLIGLRIVEFATFVAGPSGCMTLGQLGADVIRVDPLGGAADYHRWPLSGRTGSSLYWTALNKGKRSVAIDTRCDEGRELVTALATAPGPTAGIVVDNAVNRSWLSYETLAERRADVIQVHIEGHSDGRAAVDYTVNAEVGVATLTGPPNSATPVNHVLPAWDLLTGMFAATGLLAALHRRHCHGVGSFLRIALADVALAGIANLGWLAEADERGAERERHGNYVYGSFGADFGTSDNNRVMVVALTKRHWEALCVATDTETVFAALETALAADFRSDTDRFRYREIIAAVLRPWFAGRTVEQVAQELGAVNALWSRFRGVPDVAAEYHDTGQPAVLTDVDQPGVGHMLSARSPLRIGPDYGDSSIAPRLGEHTDEVLADILGLGEGELGVLHDRGVVSGPG